MIKLREREDRLRYEFLPAAEEIIETPPSPYGRIVLWSVIALVVTALVWAFVGKIDVVTTASGKLVPDGSIKTVQAATGGTIKSIDVREGQRVAKGQALLTLDSSLAQSAVDTAAQAVAVARLEREVLVALAGGLDPAGAIARAELPSAIKDSFSQMARSQQSVMAVRRGAISLGIRQAQAQLVTEQQNQQQLTDRIEAMRENRGRLAEHFAAADSIDQIRLQAQLNDLDTQIAAQQSALHAQMARVAQVQTSLSQATSSLEDYNADNSLTNFTSTIDSDKRIVELENSLARARQDLEAHTLVAPVDGTVLTVAAATVGGVATPAQPLVTIVPSQAQLYVEALIATSDIGFIHDGQVVAIKVDSFSFQRYGLLHGKVTHISPDALNDDKKGLVYKTRIALDSNKSSNGNNLTLTPGMTVNAEVTTGQRRLIEFFLDPLMTHVDTSLKVR